MLFVDIVLLLCFVMLAFFIIQDITQKMFVGYLNIGDNFIKKNSYLLLAIIILSAVFIINLALNLNIEIRYLGFVLIYTIFTLTFSGLSYFQYGKTDKKIDLLVLFLILQEIAIVRNIVYLTERLLTEDL